MELGVPVVCSGVECSGVTLMVVVGDVGGGSNVSTW